MTSPTYKIHRKFARFLYDRTRYVSQIFTRRKTLSFSHGFPSSGLVIVKICDALNLRISTPLLSPASATIFMPLTEDVYPPQPDHFINGRCVDIGKDIVAKYQFEAFGYGYLIDPLSYNYDFVRKSIVNAAHDGVIISKPENPKPGYIYQKLIDTEIDGEAEEIRVLYVGRVLDICYVKRHSLKERFAIRSTSVKIVATKLLFSTQEIESITKMCSLIGLEYGEIDVMRDRVEGLVYVIDMNRTPSGPPFAFTRSERDAVVSQLADAFISEFGDKIR